MPLSDPLPSGAVVGSTFANFPITMVNLIFPNTGSDLGITFSAVVFHAASGLFCLGGDNDYYGTTSENSGKLVQAANLPAFFTAAITRLNANFVDGGILALAPNVVGRSANADGSTAWVDITPPAVTTRGAIWTMNNGDGKIYIGTTDLSAPDRNIEVSDDNGVIWDSNPGLNINNALFNNIGILNANLNRGGTLVAVSGDTKGIFAVTATPDNNDSWDVFEIEAGFSAVNTNMCAFNADSSVCVAVTQAGNIIVSPDLIEGNEFTIALANNYFALDGVTAVEINSIVHSAALNGFVLLRGDRIGFIADSDLTRCVPGALVGLGVPIIITDGTAASDTEGNVLVPGSGTTAYISSF